MASVRINGTEFSFSLLAREEAGRFLSAKIRLKNEYLHYEQTESFSEEEIFTLYASLSRLLAGGYEREYTLHFERAGVALDLYPYREKNFSLLRETRRKQDCVAAFHFLFRANQEFLSGVYTLQLHREELTAFVKEGWKEYDLLALGKTEGKYSFVGVSPLGYTGCNYPYLDERGEVKKGEYVWVRMGLRQIEQIVYVDSVRYYTDEDAPRSVDRAKRVLRKATEEEVCQTRRDVKET